MIWVFVINKDMANSDYIQGVMDAAKGKPYSTDWYRQKIKEFGQPGRLDLIRDGKRNASPFGGALNMFVYGPKHKKKLPYYDTFPLVLPIENYSDGFLGLNFHYLPIPLRMKLLDKMLDSDLRTSYNAIKGVRLVRPTIHRYLAGYTKSQFRKIEEDELVVATLLPVHNFKKSSAKAVWADSRKMI
jgi:hypothetical protein